MARELKDSFGMPFTNYDLLLTLEEATQFREAFFDLYPGIRAWHAKCWEMAEKMAKK